MIISLKGYFHTKWQVLWYIYGLVTMKALNTWQEVWVQGWLCLTSCESPGKPCNFSGAQFLHLILDEVCCLNEICIFLIYKAVCHWVLWHKIDIDCLVTYQPSQPTVSILCPEMTLDINCFLLVNNVKAGGEKITMWDWNSLSGWGSSAVRTSLGIWELSGT